MFKRISSLIALIVTVTLASYCPASADTAQSFSLSATSPTSCTLISPVARSLIGFWNVSTSAQTVTVTFFNDIGKCTAADEIYPAVLQASQIVTFPPFTAWFNQLGLSYTLSAACSGTPCIEGLYQ